MLTRFAIAKNEETRGAAIALRGREPLIQQRSQAIWKSSADRAQGAANAAQLTVIVAKAAATAEIAKQPNSPCAHWRPEVDTRHHIHGN